MTLLSLGLHVHADEFGCIFMGAVQCFMYVLYNDQILLLTLLLFQTPALSLNLEHLESFPQTFWLCTIGHHQPQLFIVLRGLQLVPFGPQAH